MARTLLPWPHGRHGNLESRLRLSHNRERSLAGVPPLRWNAELASGAQEWADHLSSTGRFEHSPNIPGRPPEGENIWGGTPGVFRPEAMVELRSAEHTSELQSTMRNSYAVFCLKKKKDEQQHY